MMRSIVILGSTGSVGTQALDVIVGHFLMAIANLESTRAAVS